MTYYWGKYNDNSGYLLLMYSDGNFYVFKWDLPLTEDELKEFSEFTPAMLEAPNGVMYD
jgi:hypothetical protein